MKKRKKIKYAIRNDETIKIKYEKFDGEISKRTLTDIAYNNSFEDDGYYEDHIQAYCHLRNEQRVFRISRIIDVKIV